MLMFTILQLSPHMRLKAPFAFDSASKLPLRTKFMQKNEDVILHSALLFSTRIRFLSSNFEKISGVMLYSGRKRGVHFVAVSAYASYVSQVK